LRSCDLRTFVPRHSPSNAHAYRLYLVKELRLAALLICDQQRGSILTRFLDLVNRSGFVAGDI
jgi:hypothetical protein